MKGKIWCEIEFIFYGKIKYLNIIFFCPLTSSAPTVHCISALCINQTSPISRNICSAVKSNSVLTSRQLLKDNVPSRACKGSHDLAR